MFKSLEESFSAPQPRIVVKGTPGFDVLTTTLPNAVLSAGMGADTYVFDCDDGIFITIDDCGLLDNGGLLHSNPGIVDAGHDSLMFLGASREELSYQREGKDLILAHVDDIENGHAKYGVRIHQFYDHDLPDPSDPTYVAPSPGEGPYSPAHHPNESVNKIEVLYLMDNGIGIQVVDLGML